MVEAGGGSRGHLVASRLVGRDDHLATLTTALGSPGALVLIEGEAGVGKSRLLQEVLGSGPSGEDQPRASTMVAACPPFREPQTLGPLVDAIRRSTGGVADLKLSPLAGVLRPLIPEWSDELPPLPDPAEDATAARHRLFRALDELLDRLQIGLLVVEDVHWADDTTVEFLLYLVSRPDPMSVVLTYRPEDLAADSLVLRLPSRPGHGATTRIVIEPLDVHATGALVSSMLDEAPLSDEFARFLHERTDGIPFAVEESVRLLYERTDLVRRNGTWERVSLGEMQVPMSVRDAVLERFGRLRPDAQTVLRAAAVLAEPVDPEIVAATSGLPGGVSGDAAGDALAEAVVSRLLNEDATGRVSFAHALAARAVSEATPALVRRTLHRRAAQVLEAGSSEHPAQLARHFREAGDAEPWHQYGEQAADIALAAGDEAAAAELLHDLVVHGDLAPEALLRLTYKIPTATLSDPRRYDGLVSGLRRALGHRGLTTALAARLRAQLGQLLAVAERYEAARVELERALPDLDDPAEAARALTMLGWPVGTALPTSAHLYWLDQAAALAPRLEPLDRLTLAVDRVTALLVLGEEIGWAEAAHIPAESADPRARPKITRGQLNLGDMALRWGRYIDARRHLDQAIDQAEAHQYQRYRSAIAVTQVRLDWFTGRWDGLAERAADLADATDLSALIRHEGAMVRAMLSAAELGPLDTVMSAFEALIDELTGYGVEQHLVEPAATLARLRLARGDVGGALAVTGDAFTVVTASGTWIWATEIAVARVEALVAAGRLDAAADVAANFQRWLADRDAPAPRAAVATCHAILRQAGGDHEGAASAFARAATAWDTLPRPYDALLAREQHGRCLLEAGRVDDAVTALARTADAYATLGAAADDARIVGRLREHGVHLRRTGKGGRPSYGDQLSPREAEVVQLLVGGSSNQQIAEQLFLSRWTVRHHVDSAKRKLNAASRAALAAAAVEAGIASGPDGAPR